MPRRRALLAIPPAVLLIAMAVLAARAGYADTLAIDGRLESLEQALRFTPSDPTLHEVIAVESIRAPGEARNAGNAFVHLRRSLAVRPVSPYAWASLAEASYRAGVSDETFERALVRAAWLGPHEPQVQETIALYGLAMWDEIGPEARSAVDGMLAAGIARDARSMLQIAQRRGRLGMACRHASARTRMPQEWAVLCREPEAKP